MRNPFGQSRHEVAILSALCWLSIVIADANRDLPALFLASVGVSLLMLALINLSYLGAFARRDAAPPPPPAPRAPGTA